MVKHAAGASIEVHQISNALQKQGLQSLAKLLHEEVHQLSQGSQDLPAEIC